MTEGTSMNREKRLAGLALAAMLAFAQASLAGAPAAHGNGAPGSPSHEHGAAPHWSYDGSEGPEHWGDLDPSFATCKTGHLQSPIDIQATTIKAESLPPIRFDYKLAPLHVT